MPGPLNLKPNQKMVDANKSKAVNGEKKESGPGGKIPDVDELTKRSEPMRPRGKNLWARRKRITAAFHS
ncbi:hypothetical protein KC343_g13883 [Hortaea werneckii]|nr:hypothetical protein KC317_g8591 [Hortaea werneckii]KAI7605019.1 hypothetical protein KC343_g13883 [Hortaea werneckii]KAI7670056.1 hypothetical protein KC319_g5986 [Hortaea werneckii]KAI7701182.1 hypothetical protein KC322_g8001 [Hortaea werneckii]